MSLWSTTNEFKIFNQVDKWTYDNPSLFISIIQSNDTALMKAAGNGHVDVCQILLDSGANVEAKNKVGSFLK